MSSFATAVIHFGGMPFGSAFASLTAPLSTPALSSYFARRMR